MPPAVIVRAQQNYRQVYLAVDKVLKKHLSLCS